MGKAQRGPEFYQFRDGRKMKDISKNKQLNKRNQRGVKRVERGGQTEFEQEVIGRIIGKG